MLSFRPCKPIDCTSLVPAQSATLSRKLYADAICFHPTLPLVAVGVMEYVAVFDLLSGSRLGRVDVRSPIVEMSFTCSGSHLVVALQDWQIAGISLTSWKSHILVPKRVKAEKELEGCLLAVSGGPRPVVFFTKHGKEIVRYAMVKKTEMRDAKGRVLKINDSSWGVKLKLDVAKPVLHLGYHPTDQQLIVLHADGVLRGYSASIGVEAPALLYGLQVHEPLGKILPAIGTLEAIPHPTMPGGMLLLLASRLGAVTVMEQVGRNPPKVLLSTKVQGWAAVLGMGFHKDSSLILVFGVSDQGKVCPAAWKVLGRTNTPGLKLDPWKIEPSDLGPLMDQLQQAKTPAVVSRPATSVIAPKPVQQSASLDAWGLPVSASAKKEKKLTKAPVDPGTPAWLSLWAAPAAWTYEAPSTALLERQLGPLVSKLSVHQVLGAVAAQLEPAYLIQSTPALLNQTMSNLTDQELAMARRTATVPLMALVRSEPHYFGWQGGLASAMHSPLSAWKPDSDPMSKLKLPAHLFYASSGMIWKHSLAAQKAVPLLTLPSEAMEGNTRHVRHMVVEPTCGAFLIFFEACGASDDASDRWQWTLLLPPALESSSPALWFKGGKYGCFLGAEGSHFAVVEPTGSVAAVFVTALTTSPNTAPLYTINLDNASISGGSVACPLFPGPPCAVLPLMDEDEEDEEDDIPSDEEQEGEQAYEPPTPKGPRKGLGVLMWQSADGHLACTTMPFMRHAAPTGENGDTEEGPIGAGQHMGKQERQAQLELLPGEHVLQVAWQCLTSNTPVLPGDAVAAVLTCRRILIVTADLKLHAYVDVHQHVFSALAHPVTSILWVGPVLLYLTAAGQVMQMAWNGKSQPFCHVASSRDNFLVGATPNSLLLLRNNSTGAREIVSRPASMLEPLIMGWASLGASGLPGGAASLPAVRTALKNILSKGDTTTITPSLVWGLISACAWDVAAAIANTSDSTSLDSCARMAANASASQWWVVVQDLSQEVASSLYAPAPPPPGSSLHNKLVAAGAGAVEHGQISKAIELFKMAGEWRTAMVLCVCRGEMGALFTIVTELQESGASAGDVAEATALSTSLRNLYHNTTVSIPDYKLQLVDLDGSAQASARNWSMGRQGAVLQAEAVAGSTASCLIGEGEVGPLPEMSKPLPASFLGLGLDLTAKVAAAMGQPRAVSHTTSQAPRKLGFEKGGDPLEGLDINSSGPSLFDLGPATSKADTSDAQAAARADFMSFGDGASVTQQSSGLGADSSDEDLDLDDFSQTGPAARKFKIQIKSKDAAATTAGAVDLKTAVGNIKLGAPTPTVTTLPQASSYSTLPSPVGAGPSGAATNIDDIFAGLYSPTAVAVQPSPLSPAPQMAGTVPQHVQPYPSSTAAANTLSPALQAGLSPALQAAIPAAQPSQVAAAGAASQPGPVLPRLGAGGPNSVQLYQQGVARMEAADWGKAAIAFECALDKLANEPKSPGHEQRVSFCSQYYAAVRLLAVAAAGGQGAKEAKLYRFLSALKLDDRHQLALTREAVQRNKNVGNLLFCSELLTSMIMKLIGNAPEAYMAQLQQELQEIDRAGSGNKSIPRDEKLDDFAAIVSASSSKQEVDLVVDPILASP